MLNLSAISSYIQDRWTWINEVIYPLYGPSISAVHYTIFCDATYVFHLHLVLVPLSRPVQQCVTNTAISIESENRSMSFAEMDCVCKGLRWMLASSLLLSCEALILCQINRFPQNVVEDD